MTGTGRPRICRNSAMALTVYKSRVIACPGGWRGHIGYSNLCGNGYHVCNATDRRVLARISFDRAVRILGCYAFNAAHDFGRCINCENRRHRDDLAGVGMTCPRINKSERTSCITGGRIDAALTVDSFKQNRGCRYHNGISGVLCCQN